MDKKNIYIVIAIAVIVLAGFLYFKNFDNAKIAKLGDSSSKELVIKDVKPGDLDKNSIDPLLTSKQWMWKETYLNDGNKIINPVDSSNFVMSFLKGGKFSSTTDCNNVTGSYSLVEKNITLDQIASTKMACEDPYAQEQVYVSMISDAESYFFREDGNLVIMMKEGKGSITFTTAVEVE